MIGTPAHVCIMTLGGQPQVITLALDALLAQGAPIGEVIVVHLSSHIQRYRAALDCLAREFADDRYAGRPCRYRLLPVSLGEQAADDLHSDAAVDATINLFHRLIQQLKQQDATIHLCLSGGRRLLGMLSLSAALLHFDQRDTPCASAARTARCCTCRTTLRFAWFACRFHRGATFSRPCARRPRRPPARCWTARCGR
jgi:hypothetical protein